MLILLMILCLKHHFKSIKLYLNIIQPTLLYKYTSINSATSINTGFYNAMLLYGLLHFIKYFVTVLFAWVALRYFTFVKHNKLLRSL